MKVVYTQQAIQDLVDAYEYLIGRGDIWSAQRIDAAIARVVERLARRESAFSIRAMKTFS